MAQIAIKRPGFPDGYTSATVSTALTARGYTLDAMYGDRELWTFYVSNAAETDRVAIEAIIDGTYSAAGGVQPAQQPGMVLIKDVYLSSNQSLVSFNIESLPSIYRHLKFIVSARSAETTAGVLVSGVLFYLNGDVAANYDYFVHSVATVAGTPTLNKDEQLATSQPFLGKVPSANAPANRFGVFEFLIADYRDALHYKVVLANGSVMRGTSAGDLFNYQGQMHWRNIAPVTTLTFKVDDFSFVAGSRFSLYGMA